MNFKKIIGLLILGLCLLFLYPTIRKKINGYNNDKLSCTLYGFGEPFQQELNNGQVLSIGPYRYELTIENYNKPDGEVYKARVEGQELEITEDGWTIPKNYTYSTNNVEYTYSKPITWNGSFNFNVNKSIADIKSTLKSTISNDIINISQEIPVVENETDYGYTEYKIDQSIDLCFNLLVGQQNVKFCNSEIEFVESMISLIEKKYNKPLSNNRKNQIYSKYEK